MMPYDETPFHGARQHEPDEIETLVRENERLKEQFAGATAKADSLSTECRFAKEEVERLRLLYHRTGNDLKQTADDLMKTALWMKSGPPPEYVPWNQDYIEGLQHLQDLFRHVAPPVSSARVATAKGRCN